MPFREATTVTVPFSGDGPAVKVPEAEIEPKDDGLTFQESEAPATRAPPVPFHSDA